MSRHNSDSVKKITRALNGLFILDKPLGISSNKALQKIKHLLNAQKAGHTGSLDPLASGVLPICFGHATKLSQYLLDADKRYQATLTLGSCSTTCDAEGEISYCGDYRQLTEQQIYAVVNSFMGKSEQSPPMYSALKYNGQPLYKLARQGKSIVRPSRAIEIFHIEIIKLSLPEIVIDVHCSKGTYIRTLAEDIGNKLACGAYLSALRRTKAGAFTIEQSIDLEKFEQMLTDAKQSAESILLPMDRLLEHYEAIYLDHQSATDIRFGRKVYLENYTGDIELQDLKRLYDDNNLLLAIAELTKDKQKGKISLQPKRVFL